MSPDSENDYSPNNDIPQTKCRVIEVDQSMTMHLQWKQEREAQEQVNRKNLQRIKQLHARNQEAEEAHQNSVFELKQLLRNQQETIRIEVIREKELEEAKEMEIAHLEQQYAKVAQSKQREITPIMSPAPSMTPSIQSIQPSAETAATPSRQTTKPPFTDREQMVEGPMASTSTAQTTTFETQGNQPTRGFLKKLKKKHHSNSDRTTMIQRILTYNSIQQLGVRYLTIWRIALRDTLPTALPSKVPSKVGGQQKRNRTSSRDEELEKEIKSELPEQRTMHLMHVCNLFKDIFQIEQNSDFIAHEHAPAEQVLAHKAGKIQPNPDDLHFDMWHGPETPWNSVMLNILLQKLMAEKEKAHWDLPDRSAADYSTLLEERYIWAKTAWRDGRPKRTDTGEEETSEDITTHLIDKRENYLKATRTYKRRETKFERQIKTAESMVALKKDAGATEMIIWQWLLDMLKTLGQDGMSSEESDDETNDSIQSVLCPKNLPWRRNIKEELKILDDQRHLDRDIFAPQGAKPAQRIRSPRNPQTNRKPPAGLPTIFYDEEWLSDQTMHYVKKTLKVSSAKFLWMRIKAQKRW
ncbi:hypothetical protein K439DRAFT_1623904 [Ramaria rubella]|nr:hypothetical protein K439DRAFT_1623904 [Ramaria rubella]